MTPPRVVNIRGRIAEFLAMPGAVYVGRSGLYSLTNADLRAVAALSTLPPWAAMAWPKIRLTGNGLGNRLRSPRDGTLAEVLRWYEDWMLADPARVEKARACRAMVLGCWCCDDDTGDAPLRCHAQVISAVAGGRIVPATRPEPVRETGLFDGH